MCATLHATEINGDIISVSSQETILWSEKLGVKNEKEYRKGGILMVMIFQSEKARRRLLENGSVVTFRANQRKEGKDWATDKRGGKRICDIFIEQIYSVPIDSLLRDFLLRCLDESGFDSLEEWITEVKRLNGDGELSGYLYKVYKR